MEHVDRTTCDMNLPELLDHWSCQQTNQESWNSHDEKTWKSSIIGPNKTLSFRARSSENPTYTWFAHTTVFEISLQRHFPAPRWTRTCRTYMEHVIQHYYKFARKKGPMILDVEFKTRYLWFICPALFIYIVHPSWWFIINTAMTFCHVVPVVEVMKMCGVVVWNSPSTPGGPGSPTVQLGRKRPWYPATVPWPVVLGGRKKSKPQVTCKKQQNSYEIFHDTIRSRISI